MALVKLMDDGLVMGLRRCGVLVSSTGDCYSHYLIG